MATETLILRPCDICAVVSQRAALPSRAPADTPKENLCLLLSETSADDDATYITLENQTSLLNTLYVMFQIPEKYYGVMPSSMGVCSRLKSEEGDLVSVKLTMTLANIDRSDSYDYKTLSGANTSSDSVDLGIWELSTEYSTISSNVSSSDLTTLDYSGTYAYFAVGLLTDDNDGDTKTSAVARLTQMYIEVTYGEEPATETIYLKESGIWTNIPCTIYQKQNGTWASVDSTIFENGDNYVFNELV